MPYSSKCFPIIRNTVLFLILSGAYHLKAQPKSGLNTLSLSGPYSDKPVQDRLQKSARALGIHGFAESAVVTGSTWSLTPYAGYVLARRLVAGASLSAGKHRNAISAHGKPAQDVFSLAPELYARYYLTNIRVKPFIQLSAGYTMQYGKYLQGNQWEKVRHSSATGSGGIGLSWLPSKSWAIEGLYYRKVPVRSVWKDANEALRFRAGVSYFMN